jgi:aspartyl-tRNA(Asn)/glutamyl-tRNA(Gln) amidotransferase subunit C
MAASLTSDQVAHFAHLARLKLTPEEATTYARQLTAILGYVDQLSSVDTATVESLAQVSGLQNVLQADAVANDPISQADFLAGAPAAQPPHLKVKAVLE